MPVKRHPRNTQNAKQEQIGGRFAPGERAAELEGLVPSAQVLSCPSFYSETNNQTLGFACCADPVADGPWFPHDAPMNGRSFLLLGMSSPDMIGDLCGDSAVVGSVGHIRKDEDSPSQANFQISPHLGHRELGSRIDERRRFDWGMGQIALLHWYPKNNLNMQKLNLWGMGYASVDYVVIADKEIEEQWTDKQIESLLHEIGEQSVNRFSALDYDQNADADKEHVEYVKSKFDRARPITSKQFQSMLQQSQKAVKEGTHESITPLGWASGWMAARQAVLAAQHLQVYEELRVYDRVWHGHEKTLETLIKQNTPPVGGSQPLLQGIKVAVLGNFLSAPKKKIQAELKKHGADVVNRRSSIIDGINIIGDKHQPDFRYQRTTINEAQCLEMLSYANAYANTITRDH